MTGRYAAVPYLRSETYHASGNPHGKALRIVPARQGQAAANFWKFWTNGSEIYAPSRASRGFNKVSVHQKVL